MYSIMSYANRDSLNSSFLFWIPLISFSFFIAAASTTQLLFPPFLLNQKFFKDLACSLLSQDFLMYIKSKEFCLRT